MEKTETKTVSQQLREMEMGQTITLQLPPRSGAIYSAQATAYRLGRMLGCKYRTAADHVSGELTVTKEPLP